MKTFLIILAATIIIGGLFGIFSPSLLDGISLTHQLIICCVWSAAGCFVLVSSVVAHYRERLKKELIEKLDLTNQKNDYIKKCIDHVKEIEVLEQIVDGHQKEIPKYQESLKKAGQIIDSLNKEVATIGRVADTYLLMMSQRQKDHNNQMTAARLNYARLLKKYNAKKQDTQQIGQQNLSINLSKYIDEIKATTKL